MKQCYSIGGRSLIESSVHGANSRAVKGACHRGSAPLPGQQGRNQQWCKGNGLKSEGPMQPNLPQGNFLQIYQIRGVGRGKAKLYLLSLKKKKKRLFYIFWASLVAQTMKNSPAMQETWVQSLGWEDPTEEDMATHSSIFAWRLPMDRGAWRATVFGSQSRTQLK